MPRAYLRLDPGYDEHKESYPDGPYAALIAAFCHGEMQPERGRFRNERFLRAILGTRGRHVPYLIAHGDLVALTDGRLYIDGWDEWQEGDWKVTERVTRIRNRQRRSVTPLLTVPVTPDVTVPVTADRKSVSGKRSEAVSGALAEQPPTAANGAHTPSDDPYDEVVAWLASRKAWLDSPKVETDLARMVYAKGADAVIAAMAAVPGAEVATQFVYGARNALYPLAASKVAAPVEPDPEEVRRLLAERSERRKAEREAARNA